MLIIDCHGHYTTAPDAHQQFRDKQLEKFRELAPEMLDRHPELAARHVDRWLGSKAEYLKA